MKRIIGPAFALRGESMFACKCVRLSVRVSIFAWEHVWHVSTCNLVCHDAMIMLPYLYNWFWGYDRIRSGLGQWSLICISSLRSFIPKLSTFEHIRNILLKIFWISPLLNTKFHLKGDGILMMRMPLKCCVRLIGQNDKWFCELRKKRCSKLSTAFVCDIKINSKGSSLVEMGYIMY